MEKQKRYNKFVQQLYKQKIAHLYKKIYPPINKYTLNKGLNLTIKYINIQYEKLYITNQCRNSLL